MSPEIRDRLNLGPGQRNRPYLTVNLQQAAPGDCWSAMFGDLNPEDAELDGLWRQRFGQPIPLRGCGDLARQILGILPAGSNLASQEARTFGGTAASADGAS